MGLSLSIIVPVRKDSPWIEIFLESVRENAHDLDNLEVLLGIAHDDTRTNPTDGFVRVIRLDQRLRKWGVGFYTNILALNARGKLIWWLSDEVVIKTKDFDLLLDREADLVGDRIYKLSTSFEGCGGALYPILTKKWIGVTKRWADIPNIDSWVNTIDASLPQRSKTLPDLRIEDRRITEKITEEESVAEYMPPEVPFDMDDYTWGGERVVGEIQKDVDKLLRAIAVQGL